jgi:hypothetical protein
MTTEVPDPDTGGISPSIADMREVLPSPVLPTIATKLPTGTSRLTFDKVGLWACQHSKFWFLKSDELHSNRCTLIGKKDFDIRLQGAKRVAPWVLWSTRKTSTGSKKTRKTSTDTICF